MIKTPLSTMIGGAFWTPKTTILGGASKTFDQLIQSLFANNEQGFAYDPNDLSAMFEDAAGTIPVTGVGQPVGLMLDKSKGLQRGVNLTDDFDFRTWNVLGGAIAEKSSFTIAGPGGVTSNIGMVVGKMYKIDIEYTTTNPTKAVELLNGNHGGSPNLANSTSGKISCYCLAVSGLLYLRTSTSTTTVTKFMVQEVFGNHAYQTASASRPILRQNATTGAYYLEFDGSDDFLVTNSIDFTATDEVSLFAGVRKLSDVATGLVCELSLNSANNRAFALFAPATNGKNHYNFRSFGSVGVLAGTDATADYSAPNSAVLTAFGKISTSLCSLSINRVSPLLATGTQGSGNYGNYPLYIGRRAGTSIPFNGHIYSLIGLGRLTTTQETIALEKLIAKNTGVTLS